IHAQSGERTCRHRWCSTPYAAGSHDHLVGVLRIENVGRIECAHVASHLRAADGQRKIVGRAIDAARAHINVDAYVFAVYHSAGVQALIALYPPSPPFTVSHSELPVAELVPGEPLLCVPPSR